MPRAFSYRESSLLNEVHRLVGGVGGQYVREDIASLKRAGLIDSQCRPIARPEIPEQFEHLIQEKLGVLGRRARLPLPRRMLRFIAGGATMSRSGALFGHAMRCMFWYLCLNCHGRPYSCSNGSRTARDLRQLHERFVLHTVREESP